jgi:signal transduction histidine kinase
VLAGSRANTVVSRGRVRARRASLGAAIAPAPAPAKESDAFSRALREREKKARERFPVIKHPAASDDKGGGIGFEAHPFRPMQDTRRPSSPSTENPAGELASSVSASLRTPIAALRASLETLARDLEGEDPRAQALEIALEEVVRLGRQVQTLVEFALPQPLHALRCRADEIARGAVAFLPPPGRERVVLACEGAHSAIEIDGPLFSRALSLLLADALEGSCEPVLLVARCDEKEASFTIVHGHRAGSLAERGGDLALGVILARRDLARLGARVYTDRPSSGPASVLVRCPIARSQGAHS